MEKKKAERARQILAEIERMYEIKDTTEKENSHWWSFLSPDTKTWDSDGLVMPDILRQKFVEAVDAAINEIENELKELWNYSSMKYIGIALVYIAFFSLIGFSVWATKSVWPLLALVVMPRARISD